MWIASNLGLDPFLYILGSIHPMGRFLGYPLKLLRILGTSGYYPWYLYRAVASTDIKQ